jgi:hypothetical protein
MKRTNYNRIYLDDGFSGLFLDEQVAADAKGGTGWSRITNTRCSKGQVTVLVFLTVLKQT